MPNIFIIHGAYGSPKENWIPWLKAELEKMACRVFVPQFPTPEGQSLESWMNVFDKYRPFLEKSSVLVGHSIGVAFLLNLIEGLDRPIKAAFFVSGFATLLNNPAYDGINRTFVDRQFDWARIRQNCGKFYLIHSDDDPFVPLQKARELANNLGVAPFILRYGGHFNERSGYTRFDLLLQKINGEL